VNEDKSFLDRVLPVRGKVPLDVFAIIALSVFTFFGPFATYIINRQVFSFLGYFFVTGVVVAGGTVHISPHPMIFLFVLSIILAVLIAVFFKQLGPKRSGIAMMLIGVVQIALPILMTTQLRAALHGLSGVNTGWGLMLFGLSGVALAVRGFYTLYRIKILNTLDIMVLPIGLYLLINNYFPMFGLFIAFKDINWGLGILNSPWVGFDNFRFLFNSVDAWIITRNTLAYNAVFIVTSNLIGILVGLALANIIAKRFQKLYQTTILLPQLISWVIVGYIVFAFLSNEAGLVTTALRERGTNINFYTERTFWPFILTFAFNWRILGYQSAIYLSSISGVDRNLYEAASIDGAGRMQQIMKITLPMIKPTIITLVLIQVGRIFFSDFGLFFQVPMNSGLLMRVTETIDVYVFRTLMVQFRVGMASAAGFYQSIVGFVLVLTANFIVRKFNRENALF